MKNLLAAFLVLLSVAAHAQTTLNQLPAGTALTGTELIPMSQGGSSTATATTPAAIKTYVQANGGLNVTSVTLTASQIANATTTPVRVVPAQGTNTIILLVAPVVYEWTFNSAPFTTGLSGAGLFWSDGTSANSLGLDQGDLGCPQITQTAFCISPAESDSTSTLGASLLPNRGLYYFNNGDAYAGGNGTMKVIVTWTTVSQ